MVNVRTFLRDLWSIARPYWVSEDRWIGLLLLATIIGMNLALVYVSVRLNLWRNDFYNTFQDKDYAGFLHQLLIFVLIIVPAIVISVYQTYFNQMLQIRWRQWLTKDLLQRWLSEQNYYRMQLTQTTPDNPDQRIAADGQYYVDQTLSLGLGFVSNAVSLVSFLTILWGLSGPLSFSIGGVAISIPGYLVWVAVVYSILGTWITHRIGWPLARLNFQQQRFEADFRYSLVRLRENSEGVALLHGEKSESRIFGNRFGAIVDNWWAIMRRTKSLNWFTSAFGQIAEIFPILVVAPRFFSGAIQLGGLFQVSSAFSEVQGAMSWFIDSYTELAEWKATVDRLIGFQKTLAEPVMSNVAYIAEDSTSGPSIAAEELNVFLPSGKLLLENVQFALKPKESVLLSGPSGSGKSTLFRTVGGIWPFASGTIRLEGEGRSLFLPQLPYLPLGSLRDALVYPGANSNEIGTTCEEALKLCGLQHLLSRIDDVDNWKLTLSQGEQQRLAIARALIQRPDWLFLDESTSALDEVMEQHLYALLRAMLPRAGIMSIGHRSSLIPLHDRQFEITLSDHGGKLVAVSP